jgi:hypothetical protein
VAHFPPATPSLLDWRVSKLADFRQGRLLRLTIFRDRAEALKAVGLED